MLKLLLFFLVEFLFGYQFNIGGQISVGELYILFWYILKWNELKKQSPFKELWRLYLTLIMAQIFSEFFVSNGLINSLRGIMVTVFSLLHVSFLIYHVNISSRYLVAMFAAAGLSILFFINPEEASIQSVLEGENAAFVKMRIAPMLGCLAAAISIYMSSIINVIIFVFLGAALVVLGARSGGMFMIITGVLGYLLSKGKRIRFTSPLFIIALILCYFMYVLYVDAVLSGTVQSGNNHQLLDLSNPYNPLELLVRGRGEFFVGITAFIDEFWLGHGAWAMDTTRKYWRLLAEIHGGVYYSGLGTIWMPVHSVFLGWGVYNGVLAFLAGIRIVFKYIKMGFKAFKWINRTPYIYILAYSITAFLWNGLFSPPSHFRLTLPVFMAGIYFCYSRSFKSKGI